MAAGKAWPQSQFMVVGEGVEEEGCSYHGGPESRQ